MARQFRDRWEVVRAIEIEEQRNATIEQRWRQMNASCLVAKALGLLRAEGDEEELTAVRERSARPKEGTP